MSSIRRSLALSVFLLSLALPAEELRSLMAGTVVLSSDQAEGARHVLSFNEALAVQLGKDALFVQGFEIEVKIPQAAQALPGGLSYELWRRLDPAPEKTRYVYEGDRLLTQVLPARAGFVLQIPTRKDHSLKSGPYATLIPTIVEAKDFPFVFRLYPLTKGLSPELEQAQFIVKVRPLLIDKGALRLSLRYPEGLEREPVSVFLDDKRIIESKVWDSRELVLLDSGSHYLRLSSEAYRDENRAFSIEQGKILDLAVELADTSPALILEAPDSAVVLLDGIKINHVAKPAFKVSPGEHVLVCRIGDYSLTRKITAYRGKSYRIVLSIELVVQEEP